MKMDDAIRLSILTDEIGLNTGRVGDYRIKTFYQPVYHRVDGLVLPVGVASSWVPMAAWHEIDLSRFLRGIGPEDRKHLEDLGIALAFLNFEHLGIQALQLFVEVDPTDVSASGDGFRIAGSLIDRIDAAGVERDQVTCRISCSASTAAEALAGELRSEGAADRPDRGRARRFRYFGVERLVPDVAVVDPGLFGRLNGSPRALPLFSMLLGRLREAGCRVQIDCLDTPELLTAALQSGAELLQGTQLAAPALAGTIFPKAAFSVGALVSGADNVAVIGR